MTTLKNLMRWHVLLMAAAMLVASCSSDGGDDGGVTPPEAAKNENRNVPTTEAAVARLEFPRLDTSGNSMVVVHRTGTTAFDKDRVNYSLEWDKQKKSQRWSCYQLHKGYNGSYSRVVGNYPDDPDIPQADRLDKDYFYGSGFEHGHICPSADRTFAYDANMQTFYLSNMQPQYHKFNAYDKDSGDRGLWLMMENKVQTMAQQLGPNDTLFVCKGGTIDNEANIIKRISGKLIVPRYFFMAVLKKTPQGYAAFGFWGEQKNEWGTNEKLADHAMSIDKLEQLTGIDFFCNLPDKEEDKVEAEYYPRYWNIN